MSQLRSVGLVEFTPKAGFDNLNTRLRPVGVFCCWLLWSTEPSPIAHLPQLWYLAIMAISRLTITNFARPNLVGVLVLRSE